MVANSPRLFAGSYVLLRLLVPRHPPCALKNLTTKDYKDARVHCAVLKQRVNPQPAPAPTPTPRTHPPESACTREPKTVHPTSCGPSRQRTGANTDARSLRTQQRARHPNHHHPFPTQPLPVRTQKKNQTYSEQHQLQRHVDVPPMSSTCGAFARSVGLDHLAPPAAETTDDLCDMARCSLERR